MGIYVTLYKRPNGATEIVHVTKVRDEDVKWFLENDAKLSMEDIGGDFAVYADVGESDPDGEPIEAIEIAGGRSCEDTFSALRKQAEVWHEHLRLK